MPRSCRSGDMAGTFMLYQPGTDGAAVTEVRLPGSRSSQHPELRNTRTEWSPRFLVPFLFRPRDREDRVDGPAAEIFRDREEVHVGVHRLSDSGMTEPGLNHPGVQVRSDQRRGIKVTQVV